MKEILEHLGTLSLPPFLNAAPGYLLEIILSMACFLDPCLLFSMITYGAGHHWHVENKKGRDIVYISLPYAF